ncbi:MAG: transporter substrate-binding domain-containing protein [Traorella sp.]
MRRLGKLVLTVLMGLALCACGSAKNDEKTTFVVGMECGYAPFNWQTSTATDTSVSLGNAGYADGYDVQIAKRIADELGLELVIKKIEWDGLIPALGDGTIDAIIAGMTANPDREEGADFTTPYFGGDPMVMIVRKDSEMANFTDIQQFSGLNVVGQMSTSYDEVIDQINGVNHATPKSTYGEMVLSLKTKEVDGITAELPVAKGIVSANSDLTYIVFAEGKGFDADTTVSIALAEGTRGTDFFNQVQAALDKISADERDQMMTDAVLNQPVEE